MRDLKPRADVGCPPSEVRFRPAVDMQRARESRIEELPLHKSDPFDRVQIDMPRHIDEHAEIRSCRQRNANCAQTADYLAAV